MKNDANQQKSNIEALPRGVCPECLRSIAIERINVLRVFKCPYCGQPVRAGKVFRMLIYIVFYALPTVVLYHSHLPIFLRVLAWFVLAFAFSVLYIFVCKRLFVLRLERFSNKAEEFQSLGLGK